MHCSLAGTLRVATVFVHIAESWDARLASANARPEEACTAGGLLFRRNLELLVDSVLCNAVIGLEIHSPSYTAGPGLLSSLLRV